jgi:predicted nucleic acid-binding protein
MLVVDASVWVSAADATDDLSEHSRAFLSALTRADTTTAIPDFAELEVACALARRLQNGERGRALAGGIVASPMVEVHPLDAGLLRRAVDIGTARFLRAGDAVYAALADVIGAELVAWDGELIERAAALTPREWLEREG